MTKLAPLLVLLVVALACKTPAKSSKKGASGADGEYAGEAGGPRLAYAKGEDMPEADIRETEFRSAGTSEVRTIFFEYDQYGLSADATEALRGNVEWLKRAGMKVLVEGHADERGTAEYNLALGQKRAKTVREFYVRSGVAATQVGTISYGKERPECTGDYDSCGPKNRRAVTLVAPPKK